MNFDEAWPEIKAGKEVKVNIWGIVSDWLTLEELSKKYSLEELSKAIFQIKQEPRDFWIVLNTIGLPMQVLTDKPDKEHFHKVIKVREVIE